MFFKRTLSLSRNGSVFYSTDGIRLCAREIKKILQEQASKIEVKVSSKRIDGYSPLKLCRKQDIFSSPRIYYSIKNAKRPRGGLLAETITTIIDKTDIGECETLNLYFKIRKIS
jgi:hypothetical protein